MAAFLLTWTVEPESPPFLNFFQLFQAAHSSVRTGGDQTVLFICKKTAVQPNILKQYSGTGKMAQPF